VNISIIGSGYVGLVTGTCLADFGLSVTCVDQDETKISLLNSGGVPIYEPNLAPLIEKNISAGRLTFTTDLQVPPSLRATEGSAAIPPSSPSPLRGEGRVRVKYPFDLVSNPEFRNLDLLKIKKLLRSPILLDLRNLYDLAKTKSLGFVYEGIGRTKY